MSGIFRSFAGRIFDAESEIKHLSLIKVPFASFILGFASSNCIIILSRESQKATPEDDSVGLNQGLATSDADNNSSNNNALNYSNNRNGTQSLGSNAEKILLTLTLLL